MAGRAIELDVRPKSNGRVITGRAGQAIKVFRLDPPLKYEKYGADDLEERQTRYVVVSAVTMVPFSGPETYIFPADKEGEVTSWGELPGSYRGGTDITKALRNAGYEIVSE